VVKPETCCYPFTDFNQRDSSEDITVHIAKRDREALPWMIGRVPVLAAYSQISNDIKGLIFLFKMTGQLWSLRMTG
jgi:hypothetical protein